jgi:hypothetical protein
MGSVRSCAVCDAASAVRRLATAPYYTNSYAAAPTPAPTIAPTTALSLLPYPDVYSCFPLTPTGKQQKKLKEAAEARAKDQAIRDQRVS